MLPDDDETYPNGPCPCCEGPLDDEYECPDCAPRVPLEDTPVRASFEVDAAGRVTWAGACTEAFGELLESLP